MFSHFTQFGILLFSSPFAYEKTQGGAGILILFVGGKRLSKNHSRFFLFFDFQLK
jgi:hypothetical protein